MRSVDCVIVIILNNAVGKLITALADPDAIVAAALSLLQYPSRASALTYRG